MHILYIHQHFTTNAGASGTRSFDYARYLAAVGHKVTVITGVYALGPFGDLGSRLFALKHIEGVRVLIINIRYSNQMSHLSRIWSFLGFALLATVASLRQGRVDVVLASSTPLTVGVPALAMRWLRGVPYVFEVRDIWPEFAVSIGVLKNPWVIKLSYWAEAIFYRHAARIQTISEGMRRILDDRGLDERKLTVVPTGVDLSLYAGVKPDSSLRRELGWQDRLLAVYAGAHSDANGLEYVIEAATHLEDRKDIGILLIGDGRRKADLQRAARERGLANLAFHDKVPKEQLIRYLADADVGMLILKDLPDFRCAMPNKFFDYMAAGLAIVVNFEGDAAEVLRSAGAGTATQSGDPKTLADQLLLWAEDQGSLQQAKNLSRELAKRFDRKCWAERLCKTLSEVSTGR